MHLIVLNINKPTVPVSKVFIWPLLRLLCSVLRNFVDTGCYFNNGLYNEDLITPWMHIHHYDVLSSAVRHDLRPRDHHHPADDERHRQVPRHAQQRPGVHEAARGQH